jgi:hypothetical protein
MSTSVQLPSGRTVDMNRLRVPMTWQDKEFLIRYVIDRQQAEDRDKWEADTHVCLEKIDDITHAPTLNGD